MEVKGFDNYLIYPNGNVYSKNINGFLKGKINNCGYSEVTLSKDGEPKTLKIHRLVALHYIPNPDNKPQVDHEDRDRSNNDISNLSWVTQSENCQNTVVYKSNKSTGIKNISYEKPRNRYKYKKEINKVKHEKTFKTLEEALEYKKEYELKYCKE
jgi:hypothetical protein